MQVATMLSLVGASVGVIAYALTRQRVMALAWLFSLAYTVFDKVFPSALPEPVVTGFAGVFLVLTLVFCWQSWWRSRGRHAARAAS